MGAIKMPIGKNNWDVKAYRNKLENESMKHQKKLGEPEAAPGKKSLHFFFALGIARVLQFHLALH